MKHKYMSITALLMAGSLLLGGCGTNTGSSGASSAIQISGESQAEKSGGTEAGTTEGANTLAAAVEYFSDRDLSAEVDESEAVAITLNGASVSSDSDSVSIDGSTVTIKEEGTYVLSGSLTDGSVIVDAEDAKVQLVLEGVSITSETFAPIYVAQADKVFVTLAEGTENELINGGGFTQIDDSNVDAVIFSRDDLTLNGSGALTIQSPAGHGIVGKDDVTITGGTYTITAAATAIRANDSIAIADGSFTLTAGSDGLHAENDEDESLGYIYIENGSFDIDAGDDGIHATTTLVVDGGSINIQAAEGMEATNITINDGDISIAASDDGINASRKSSLYSVKVTINGGDITIVMGAGDTDGVDANGDIEINGGTIDVTGNSTFDYDNSGVINGGTVIVNGEEVTTLPEQMMGGGRGGMGGNSGGMGGNFGGMGGNSGGMGGNSGGMGNPPSGMGGNFGGMGNPPSGMGGNFGGMENPPSGMGGATNESNSGSTDSGPDA